MAAAIKKKKLRVECDWRGPGLGCRRSDVLPCRKVIQILGFFQDAFLSVEQDFAGCVPAHPPFCGPGGDRPLPFSFEASRWSHARDCDSPPTPPLQPASWLVLVHLPCARRAGPFLLCARPSARESETSGTQLPPTVAYVTKRVTERQRDRERKRKTSHAERM